jgi:hypothetical protein
MARTLLLRNPIAGGLRHYRRPRPAYSSPVISHFSVGGGGDEEAALQPLRRVLYEAPLANPIKSLKRVSVTTALLSLTIPPAVITMGSTTVPLSGQVAVTAVTMIASIGSTAAIHYLFSPYVLRLSHLLPPSIAPMEGSEEAESAERLGDAAQEASGEPTAGEDGDVHPPLVGSSILEAHTMTIFGGETATTFRLDQIVPFGEKPPRPFVNFGCQSSGGQTPSSSSSSSSSSPAERYFFVHTSIFEEKKLLRKMLGRPLKDSER